MLAEPANRPATPAARHTAKRMADFITHTVASSGSVDRDALLLDFTSEEIDAHFESAKQIARRAGKASRQ